MLILAHFLNGIAYLLDGVLIFVFILIFLRAILSWFSPDPFNPLMRMLVASTDPLLYPVQKRLPTLGGLDLSPLVLIFLVLFLRQFLVNLTIDYATQLRVSAMDSVVSETLQRQGQ